MKTNDYSIEHLRALGYRVTPQRLAILQILKESEQHLTPGEVFRRAQSRLPGLTEPTVYRTLDFLAQQGLALPAHLGNGQFAYEYAGHKHHHLVCRSCGHMMEVDHQDLLALYQQFEMTTGYQIDSMHLTFFGTCPGCQKN